MVNAFVLVLAGFYALLVIPWAGGAAGLLSCFAGRRRVDESLRLGCLTGLFLRRVLLHFYAPTPAAFFDRLDALMTNFSDVDFTNGSVAVTRAFTAEESLACSLENPEYCESCQ